MAQTADIVRVYDLMIANFNALPADASATVYLGAAVGEDASTGAYRQLVAGDTFAGFCTEKCVNPVATDAGAFIRLRPEGLILLTVANITAQAQNGDPVYASDSQTFTTASTGNTQIGKVYRWDAAAGKPLVHFQATSLRSI